MYKKIILSLLCIILTVPLTSCFGALEVNDWAYVYTIGLDKGLSDALRYTIQIPTMKNLSTKGNNGTSDTQSNPASQYTSLTIDAPAAFAGSNMLNTTLPRDINFTHLKMIVISEELARDGIGDILNAFNRFGQVRRITNLVIVKGSASEFIKNFNPLVGASLPKVQEDILQHDKTIALVTSLTLGDFLKQMKTFTDQPAIPLAAINDFSKHKEEGQNPKNFKSAGDHYAGDLPRSGGNNFEFMGSAIFDGDKMVGTLNGDETRMLLMARGEFQRAYIPIHDPLEPSKPETLDARQQKKPSIKVTFDEDRPVIDLKIFLEGDIMALRSRKNYESEELKPLLEKNFSKFIKEELDKTIEKCKRVNCDAFGFGKKAVMQFSTIQEWEEYNWLAHFKDAEIHTEVEFIIRRTGSMSKTNPTRYSGGGEN